jgi:hypothetical protein
MTTASRAARVQMFEALHDLIERTPDDERRKLYRAFDAYREARASAGGRVNLTESFLECMKDALYDFDPEFHRAQSVVDKANEVID